MPAKHSSNGSRPASPSSDSASSSRNSTEDEQSNSEAEDTKLLPKPNLPQAPKELFAQRKQNDVAQDSDDAEPSDEQAQDKWAALEEKDRLPWEAEYGRQMLKYHDDLAAWKRRQLQEKFGSKSKYSWDENEPMIFMPEIEEHLAEFFMKSVASVFDAVSPNNLPPGKGISTKDIEQSKEKNPNEAKILYRAQLYDLQYLREGSHGASTRTAVLANTYESPQPVPVKVSESISETGPAFVITVFLASLPSSRHSRRRARAAESISENYETIEQSLRPPPDGITARAEAGRLLTIHSQTIIDAIRAVAPDYPELLFEGSSLILEEPFCLLLQYRKQMIDYNETVPIASGSTEDASAADNTSSGPEDGTNTSSKEAPGHIEELYSFLDPIYADLLAHEQTLWNQASPTCTFEWCWLLFPPRSIVYERNAENNKIRRAYWVKNYRLDGLFSHDRETKRPQPHHKRLDTRLKLELKHILEGITLKLAYLTHDGRKWRIKNIKKRIRPFHGQRQISDLPVFPARFLAEKDEDEAKHLISRGRRYYSLVSKRQAEYHGQALSGTRRWIHGRVIMDLETYHYDEDVSLMGFTADISAVKDYMRGWRETIPASELTASYWPIFAKRAHAASKEKYSSMSAQPNSEDEDHVENEELDSRRVNIAKEPRVEESEIIAFKKRSLDTTPNSELGASSNLLEEAYMVCDPYIVGYVIRERQWVLLDVDKISDCNFNEGMIDELQVSEETKTFLQALSDIYMTPQVNMSSMPEGVDDGTTANNIGSVQRWSADFVPGKGQGQIILLHGRPGVGKTSSVESVAESTKQPLITIPCGALGGDARLLQRWLRIGILWNAVLLFEEAEVFLETRERGTIAHNESVSFFLGALEYHPGILFLTTNRIGVLDEAVLSRIHVVLHFPDLADEDRERIWDTSFRKLTLERPEFVVDFTLHDYVYRDETFKALGWNGRDIRNAFSTMIALAEWKNRKSRNQPSKEKKILVKREDLQQVVNMSTSFKKYMQSLRGTDEAGHAKSQLLRDDQFYSRRKG